MNLKCCAEMCEVVFKSGTENEDVIKENKNELPQVRKEDLVHQSLEGDRCIS